MAQHRKSQLSPELALASEVFDKFCGAATLKTILGNYRYLCEILNLQPTNYPQFYPKLRTKLCSWRAQALWNKFDKRANHKCYNRGKACSNTRVLIIGAGPCGLRAAIEAQLLGAKVVVIEKRDRVSRNNVLHLWPFVIHDLRALGAKKFFGKFCAGSIDHISIRQVQCILLKVALLLGVELHEGVGFESLIPPTTDPSEEKAGWRAKVQPADHPVSQYEFDVLIGADGKRNTLEGFKRKEFRGKLAIAITANFINHRSEAEARVEEISGVAYIFNQKFFKDLYMATGIDLENIVYYKDETHYFVMTAKKHSLLNKGVILNDYADTAKLLALENVNRDALLEYAKEAANFSTNYKLPQLQFAVNHGGQPDVAMFDFTSMYAAENASRMVQLAGYKLLMCLVGDSLLEPFWPTGSGCARGFLSSMDACWAIRSWNNGCANPLEVLAERESIYRLLGQTTPENLSRDTLNYTLDPHTRYPNLNTHVVLPIQVTNLYAVDDSSVIEQCLKNPSTIPDYHKRRRKKDNQIHQSTLLTWLKRQLALYRDIHVDDTNKSFKDGLALCAIIHHYRPDIIDFNELQPENVSENNQLAFDILEKEYGILPVMTGMEMENCEVPDNLTMLSYLTQVYNTFKGEIPYIKKKPRKDVVLDEEMDDNGQTAAAETNPIKKYDISKLSPAQRLSLLAKVTTPCNTRKRHHRDSRSPSLLIRSSDTSTLSRRSRKRKSGTSPLIEERRKNLENQHNHHSRNEKPHHHHHHHHNNHHHHRKMPSMPHSKHSLETDGTSLYNKCRSESPSTSARIMKSIHMLQRQSVRQDSSENENVPFEDYSMFLYRQSAPEFKERVKSLERKLLYPDRDPKELQEVKRVPMEGDFSGRVKDIENKLKGTCPIEKKPHDLLRAIGKIEKTDWNVKEIEKKIEENKFGKSYQSKVEKVPKWSREQFDDKYLAVKQKLTAITDNDQSSSKYANIDRNLKVLDQKLRNGSLLEQGQRGANKVSAMAAQLATSNQQLPEEKLVPQKSTSARQQIIVGTTQGGSEICHFCSKRVYLMERLSAEGKFFHRGCFRCEYCSISLRLGNYTFDRDGKCGNRFYCSQHFGLPGTLKMKLRNRNEDFRKLLTVKENDISPAVVVTPIGNNRNFHKMDTTDTPERVEFENLDMDGEDSGDVLRNEMDEDEWTDHNFGTSANELASSDDISELSESEDEDEGYAQALDVPSFEPKKYSSGGDVYGSQSNATNAAANGATSTSGETNNVNNSSSAAYDQPMLRKINNNSYSDDESNEKLSYNELDSEDSDEDSDTATECEEDIKARELRMQEVRLEVPERISHSDDTGSDTEVTYHDAIVDDDRIYNSSSSDDNTDSSSSDDTVTLDTISDLTTSDISVPITTDTVVATSTNIDDGGGLAGIGGVVVVDDILISTTSTTSSTITTTTVVPASISNITTTATDTFTTTTTTTTAATVVTSTAAGECSVVDGGKSSLTTAKNQKADRIDNYIHWKYRQRKKKECIVM